MFIPITGPCGYASKHNHTHPTYCASITFGDITKKSKYYNAQIFSPEIPHNDIENEIYYALLFDKDFFESQFKLYADKIPVFSPKNFTICSDILKTLNTFAFEYEKNILNSDITLDSLATVITHWVIRSILGETLNMRSISSDYSVARAQQYIEHHYSEKITLETLANLSFISVSNLSRKFKKELKMTPIEYISEIRIERSKFLLRRKSIPITDIALQCGFGTSAYFSSSFIKHIGITPTKYREKYID